MYRSVNYWHLTCAQFSAAAAPLVLVPVIQIQFPKLGGEWIWLNLNWKQLHQTVKLNDCHAAFHLSGTNLYHRHSLPWTDHFLFLLLFHFHRLETRPVPGLGHYCCCYYFITVMILNVAINWTYHDRLDKLLLGPNAGSQNVQATLWKQTPEIRFTGRFEGSCCIIWPPIALKEQSDVVMMIVVALEQILSTILLLVH